MMLDARHVKCHAVQSGASDGHADAVKTAKPDFRHTLASSSEAQGSASNASLDKVASKHWDCFCGPHSALMQA